MIPFFAKKKTEHLNWKFGSNILDKMSFHMQAKMFLESRIFIVVPFSQEIQWQ